MTYKPFLITSILTLSAAMLVTPALAAPVSSTDPNNVALTADGASFVAASSYNSSTTNLSAMEDNPISGSPGVVFANGDPRYIFADQRGASQTYEIKLGSVESLTSFSAADALNDPRGIDAFNISVSVDGTTFTPVMGSATTTQNGSIGVDTLTAQSPVTGEYVLYDFGAGSDVANDGQFIGTAFYYVTADAVAPGTGPGSPAPAPEPATWGLLLCSGLGLLGVRSLAPKLRTN